VNDRPVMVSQRNSKLVYSSINATVSFSSHFQIDY